MSGFVWSVNNLFLSGAFENKTKNRFHSTTPYLPHLTVILTFTGFQATNFTLVKIVTAINL